jgi:hypothetical protein
MFEVVLMSKVATSFKIMLIIFFFSLTTKGSILLLARLIDFASKVTLEACVNNVFAFAINEFSTKI